MRKFLPRNCQSDPTARDSNYYEGYTFGGAREPEVLRATVPKGELDGDTGLVRGERSAGLLTGQAGAGCRCLPVHRPVEPGQLGGTPQMSFWPSRDRLASSVSRWSQIRAFGACQLFCPRASVRLALGARLGGHQVLCTGGKGSNDGVMDAM
jgi:hypothetical protein